MTLEVYLWGFGICLVLTCLHVRYTDKVGADEFAMGFFVSLLWPFVALLAVLALIFVALLAVLALIVEAPYAAGRLFTNLLRIGIKDKEPGR